MYEIIEKLKVLDYENKINVRLQLKDLIIKVVMLTNELDKYNVKYVFFIFLVNIKHQEDITPLSVISVA